MCILLEVWMVTCNQAPCSSHVAYRYCLLVSKFDICKPVGTSLVVCVFVVAGKIYRWQRRFRSCPAVATMCIILHAWRHGSRSITRALCVGLSCLQMTWHTKTRKNEIRGKQKTGRVLPMLCLILTFCTPDGRDVHVKGLAHNDLAKASCCLWPAI